MKKFLALASVLAIFSIGVIGCGDKDKAADATPPASTSSTPPSTAPATKPAMAADEVKDKVEAAIKADDKLKAETIMVDHKDGKVTLKGDVTDNAAKKQAGDTAMKAVADAKSTDKVMNMLMSKKH